MLSYCYYYSLTLLTLLTLFFKDRKFFKKLLRKTLLFLNNKSKNSVIGDKWCYNTENINKNGVRKITPITPFWIWVMEGNFERLTYWQIDYFMCFIINSLMSLGRDIPFITRENLKNPCRFIMR